MLIDLEKQFVAPRVEKISIFTSTEKRRTQTVFQIQNHCIDPHASKILLRIIQGRLATYIEREIAEEKAGFKKGRGMRDQITNISWSLERAMEYGKSIFMCFVDYIRVFNCVDHSWLWNTLRSMGVPEHLIVHIKGLYTKQEATVRTEYGNRVV